MQFDAASGKLSCEYCDSSYSVEEISKLFPEAEDGDAQEFISRAEAEPVTEDTPDWDVGDLNTDWGADAERMQAFNCPSCGAELITDDTTAATACPYCGNPSVVPGRFAGTLKPDLIIPFQLEKEAAIAALKQHYSKKPLLPNAFKDENHIKEIKGIYVPFWLYDAQAQGKCVYHGTRSHSFRRGDYLITETYHFRVRRDGTIRFSRIPADGSQKMADDYMDSMEPYDYSALVPFSTAYLPGFLADRYDVSAQENAQRADERCRSTVLDTLRMDALGYQTLTTREANVQIQRRKVRYALLPVWTLHTKWQGKDYLFMMNGQTGKMVGDLPVDTKKFWLYFASIAAGSGLLFWLLGFGRAIAQALAYMMA